MAYIGKSPTGSGVRQRYTFTATGGETSLSGTDDNAKTLQFSDGEYVDVYLNGVLLVQGTDYGVGTANTIDSLTALVANDIVEIITYDIYNIADANRKLTRFRYYKTAVGAETSISGTDDNGATITFPANAEIEVRLNGISLVQGVDFNTNTANTVGGLDALTAGQMVEIIYYKNYVLADTVSKAAGGTFGSDIGITGDLTAVNGTFSGDVTVSSSDPTITFVDGSGSASISGDGGHITYDSWTANRDHIFTGAGNERFRVLGDGGVTFNGDTAAANALDDYEEGTWTPGVTTATSVESESGGHGAHYTKIGNLVTIQAYFQWSNTTNNNSNTFFITGLPFTSISDYGSFNIGYVGTANMNDAVGVVNVNTTQLYFHQNDGSGSALNNSNIHSRGLTTIILTASYWTNS